MAGPNTALRHTAAVVVMIGLLVARAGAEEQRAYIGYADFIAKVEDGSIRSVSFGRYGQIRGAMRTAEGERLFMTHAEPGSASDTLLTRFLKAHEVPTGLHDEESLSFDGPWWLMMMGFGFIAEYALPLVTILLLLRIGRRLSRLEKANASQKVVDGAAGA